MGFPQLSTVRRRAPAIGFALAMVAFPAFAETNFPAPADFGGRFSVTTENPAVPVVAGSKVTIDGSGLQPGQKLILQRGSVVLTPAEGVVADAEGRVSYSFTLPADAAPGVHPVIAILENPSATKLVDLKVSIDLPLSGQDAFTLTSVKAAPGLYQLVYSPRADALFVTSASFRPPSSLIQKLDPKTLAVIAESTPPAFPEAMQKPAAEGEAAQPAAPVGVFGIEADDEKGTLWVTNTFDNTVAVYKQDDLSLVKQFAPGMVSHARDVKVDAKRGRAYASASASDTIHVFDTATLEKVDQIRIKSGVRGGDFSLMGLAIDTEGGRLFAPSRETDELAVIDLNTDKVSTIYKLPGAKWASGVFYDASSDQVYVASQYSDDLMILNASTGEVVHDVTVGAGALNVVVDPASKLAFTANRGSGTVTVVSPAGEVVANLPVGSFANHLALDGKGNVWVVNKAAGPKDATGDHVTLIQKKAE